MGAINITTGVANSQSDVVTKTNALVAEYNIQTTEVVDFKVTPFGAQKFLLTLLFKSPFKTYRNASLGLNPVFKAYLSKIRKVSLAGLKPLFQNQIGKNPKPLFGLKPILRRKIGYREAPLLGLKAFIRLSRNGIQRSNKMGVLATYSLKKNGVTI